MRLLPALLVAVAWLTGCVLPPERVPPPSLVQPTEVGLMTGQATPQPATDWWTQLGDAALDHLVAQALAGQPGLRAAAARLARAEAATLSAQAESGPRGTVAAGTERQRFSANGLTPPPIAGADWNIFKLRFLGSLTLDFFGRNEASLQAALGAQRATAAELAAARQLLAAEVVRTHVALARVFDLRELAARVLGQREAMQVLAGQRLRAGLDRAGETRLADGAVAQVRRQIAALDEQIALDRHRLAVLSGQAPQALADWRPALAPLQAPALPPHLGADLLGRRPEVVAARWRVEAATQRVELARARFYPDIDLVALIGLNAIGLDRVFSLGSREFTVGPAISLPLFDAARLQASLQGQSAELEAAVAEYHGTVLAAVREAVDAVATLQAVSRQQAEQAGAQAAALAIHDLARQRRQAGVGSELDALAAESGVLAQRQQTIELRARELDAQVALMHALGGGWQEPTGVLR